VLGIGGAARQSWLMLLGTWCAVCCVAMGAVLAILAALPVSPAARRWGAWLLGALVLGAATAFLFWRLGDALGEA
jgi:hypothetical protein